jgi:hypothetical protein
MGTRVELNWHVRRGSEAGPVVFDRLVGEPDAERYYFDSGNGWVDTADLTPSGWVLCAGWAPPHAADCPRIAHPVSQLPGYCTCGRVAHNTLAELCKRFG